MEFIWSCFPVAQLVKNLPAVWETWVQSLRWEDPLEKGKATHSSVLAWRIPWTVQSMESQSRTRLSDFHCHFGLWVCGTLGCSKWSCHWKKDEFSSRVILTGGHSTKMPSSMWTMKLFFGEERMSSYEIHRNLQERDKSSYNIMLTPNMIVFSLSSPTSSLSFAQHLSDLFPSKHSIPVL